MTTNETARPVRDRDSRLKVGVSPEERATIEAHAAAGLSVASYLRVAGLNQPLQRLADRQASDVLVRLHGELGEVQRLAGLGEPHRPAAQPVGHPDGAAGVIAKIVPARTAGDFVRLGRYIIDAKAEGHSTAAERLSRYVVDSAHAGEKVAWSRVTNCGTDNVRLAMLQIRNTQACNTRPANKTLHLVVSFPVGERPNDRQLHHIEDCLCAALGMADHQRLSALHVNTDHAHLHVALNRVHPETYTRDL
ncbi:MAG: relaxase/mobilization nuclease domain-containing protein [Magnetospirillum sp.]|nr:relaxase/mobilization nuclease domain-containing protein [Magnetospirillum sp.]